MENTFTQPAGPEIDGLTWRKVDRDNLAALAELARACLRIDGGLGFLFVADFLQERYFPDAPGAATGAFDPQGELAACASVYLEDALAPRAALVGLVRPDFRRRRIGDYLLRWSEVQARGLLARFPEGQRSLLIRTESLIEPAERLYRAHGFERTFEELVMRCDLSHALPEHPFPQDVAIETWRPENRQQFYQAYYAAFRERPGFPGPSAEEWIGGQEENDLIPEWTLLALAGRQPAGFVMGNIDLTTDPAEGYIQQLGVVPSQRRRGLASALITRSMRQMQAAGAPAALLTVHINNPGAIETYRSLGFATVGRRARYERMGF